MRSSRKNQGSAESKLKMAKALADMELTDQTINLLGDEGAIPPLVKMISVKGISFGSSKESVYKSQEQETHG